MPPTKHGVYGAQKRTKPKIANAKLALASAEQCVHVQWQHVKAHSGDKWNDCADELAKEGAAPALRKPQLARRGDMALKLLPARPRLRTSMG
eukprot:2003138-Prymnesium_polylepis.1